MGVRMVGRLAGIRDGKAQFSGSLRNQCALSDLKMNRLLNTIDEWATANGLDGEVEPSSRLPPTQVPESPPLTLDLAGAGIRYDRLGDRLPPRSIRGCTSPCSIARAGYVTTAAWSTAPGMYLMGMQFLRRRKSALIDGAGDDARDLSDHLVRYLDERSVLD